MKKYVKYPECRLHIHYNVKRKILADTCTYTTTKIYYVKKKNESVKWIAAQFMKLRSNILYTYTKTERAEPFNYEMHHHNLI